MKEEVSAWRMELDKAKRCVAAMKTYSEINQEMLENIPPQALKKSSLSPKIEGPTAAPSSGQVDRGVQQVRPRQVRVPCA